MNEINKKMSKLKNCGNCEHITSCQLELSKDNIDLNTHVCENWEPIDN